MANSPTKAGVSIVAAWFILTFLGAVFRLEWQVTYGLFFIVTGSILVQSARKWVIGRGDILVAWVFGVLSILGGFALIFAALDSVNALGITAREIQNPTPEDEMYKSIGKFVFFTLAALGVLQLVIWAWNGLNNIREFAGRSRKNKMIVIAVILLLITLTLAMFLPGSVSAASATDVASGVTTVTKLPNESAGTFLIIMGALTFVAGIVPLMHEQQVLHIVGVIISDIGGVIGVYGFYLMLSDVDPFRFWGSTALMAIGGPLTMYFVRQNDSGWRFGLKLGISFLTFIFGLLLFLDQSRLGG